MLDKDTPYLNFFVVTLLSLLFDLYNFEWIALGAVSYHISQLPLPRESLNVALMFIVIPLVYICPKPF